MRRAGEWLGAESEPVHLLGRVLLLQAKDAEAMTIAQQAQALQFTGEHPVWKELGITIQN